MGISYQRGWVRSRGKKWHGCFRRAEIDSATNQPKLVTASIVLGLKSEVSKSQARERLEEELAKLGGRSSGEQVVPNGSVTFAWFVENRYLPLKEGDWREETAKVKTYLIQADLVDAFRDYRLESFDKLNFQVIRRTIATLGKNMGHPKDIQGLMRHTRLATTMDVYMQSLEPEVRKAINSIHHELIDTNTEGSTRKPIATVARSEKKTSAIGGESAGASSTTEKNTLQKARGTTQKARRAARFCYLRPKCGQTI